MAESEPSSCGRVNARLALLDRFTSRNFPALAMLASTRKRVKLCLFVSMPSFSTLSPYILATSLWQMAACPRSFSLLIFAAALAVSSASTTFTPCIDSRKARHCISATGCEFTSVMSSMLSSDRHIMLCWMRNLCSPMMVRPESRNSS